MPNQLQRLLALPADDSNVLDFESLAKALAKPSQVGEQYSVGLLL